MPPGWSGRQSCRGRASELSDAIFGLEPRTDLIHRMVRYQLLKRRAGTHHVQDRSDVTVTGKKMYRQNGTATPTAANEIGNDRCPFRG